LRLFLIGYESDKKKTYRLRFQIAYDKIFIQPVVA
jgi:hypothetical protein